MQNDEKILKILEALQQGQERLEKRMDKSDNTQTRIITALDTVKAGIEDVQGPALRKEARSRKVDKCGTVFI